MVPITQVWNEGQVVARATGPLDVPSNDRLRVRDPAALIEISIELRLCIVQKNRFVLEHPKLVLTIDARHHPFCGRRKRGKS
jgi:hypothetical protein